MKIHRFIGSYDLAKNEVEITDQKTIKQIRSVLRLKEGEKIVLSDGKGTEAEVELVSITSSLVTGTVLETRDIKNEGRVVSLYLAILKKENFELAVQKAVECGVAEIIPVITERTVKTGLNTERIEKIIKEASEQCGQNIVATLSNIMNFNEALIRANDSDEKVIYTPSLASDGVNLVKNEYKPNQNSKNISIFIGPEGGFTDNEITLAKNSGYTVASLGNLVLRGETAGIIATYRAVHGI